MGLSTLSGLSRGQNGTTPAAHSAGASIVPLNDPLHWTYDDAYWVYGQAPNEVWVKYSDGSVWQQGGTTPASLPQITGVQVIPNGTTATVTWTTNVAAACWVDYDTYGAAEAYNGQRPASWWPNYLQHTNLNDPGAPAAATSHSRTLTGLTPGATYHYRVVCRGPAPAVTADATFVAGGAGPTPTVPPAATPTRTPSRAATPAATGTATATPPASPTSAATSSSTPAVTATPAAGWISVSPTTVSQNASITVQWGNFTAHDSGSYWFMYRTGDPDSATNCCGGYGLSANAVSGSYTGSVNAPPPGTYEMRLFTSRGRVATSNSFTVQAAAGPPPAHPNVGVITTPDPSAHMLQTVVTARDADCAQGNNQLQALRFTRLINASVDVPTSPPTGAIAGPQTVSLPGHPAALTLAVHRMTDSQPAVVEFTVTDGCGDWPTLVGGGPDAF